VRTRPVAKDGDGPAKRPAVTVGSEDDVGGGLSNDEIAAKLYVSRLTAKTNVSRILTKLGARDRAQLVVTAYETGLVTPGGR
jgi:hypothetical protein